MFRLGFPDRLRLLFKERFIEVAHPHALKTREQGGEEGAAVVTLQGLSVWVSQQVARGPAFPYQSARRGAGTKGP